MLYRKMGSTGTVGRNLGGEGHPYLKARASLKAPLCSEKPNSSSGRAVSQVEARFSFSRSTAYFIEALRVDPTLAAEIFELSCLCLRMSFLPFSWAEMVSRRYPACWDSIKTHSGAEIDSEAENSLEGRVTGLTMPRPPRRAGKPNKLRSRSLTGALPVQVGISRDLIVSSSGCRRDSIFWFVLARHVRCK